MTRTEPLTWEHVYEGLLVVTLLEAEQGTHFVLGWKKEDEKEYVRYEEEPEEAQARAKAATWRAEGLEVAVWRRVG
jgi:hypothetical protein